MDSAVSVELFVEILNRYVYYFDQQNDQVGLSIYTIVLRFRSPYSGYCQIPQRSY